MGAAPGCPRCCTPVPAPSTCLGAFALWKPTGRWPREHPHLHRPGWRPDRVDVARHSRRPPGFRPAGRVAGDGGLSRRGLGHAGLRPQRADRALYLQGAGAKLRRPDRGTAGRRRRRRRIGRGPAQTGQSHAAGPQHRRHGGTGGGGTPSRSGEPTDLVRHHALIRPARRRLAAGVHHAPNRAPGRRSDHGRPGRRAGAADGGARLADPKACAWRPTA